MPINKNAYLRFMILDQLLSGQKPHSFSELMQKINEKLEEKGIATIKRRQLYNDLNFLETEFGAEFKKTKSGREILYRYAEPNFSIRWGIMKATMQEIDQVLSTLAHLYGPAFDDTTRRVIAEIKSNIRGTKPDDRPYIFLDHNEDVTGLEYLNELADAILNHHVLKIRYQRFHTSVAEEIIFHPYCIKEYNYRWFVLGYHENQQVWNWVLALDRIKSIEREDKISFRRRDQDWKAYFEELIGVTWPEDEKPEQVIIVFSKEFSPYIETKPLHPSQKKRWLPDGRMEVRIRVILNYELENLILSFGQHAQVIAPERLKNRIQERLQQALKQYGSV